jgi:hypothetical protein
MASTGRLRIELIVENDACCSDEDFLVTCDESGGMTIDLEDSGPRRLSVLVSPAGRNRFGSKRCSASFVSSATST